MSKNQMYMMMAGHYENTGDIKKAKDFYKKSIRMAPSAAAHQGLGLLLKGEGNLDEAKVHFLDAVYLEPNNINCIYNLGVIERIEGDYESSIRRYQTLKEMGLEDTGLDMSMGVLFSETGDLCEALKCYENALHKNKSNDLLLFNYSLCLMTLGDYKKGLEFYEKRIWHAKPPGEEWDGKNVNVLVSPEQGNGDLIQFSRYICFLKPRCQKITLLCNAQLVELMRGIKGIDEVVEFNPGDEFVQVKKEKKEEGLSAAVPYSNFIRIMSIPYAIGLNPPQVPFERHIIADKDKVKLWKNRIKSKGKLKVGLCWQGGKRSEPEIAAVDKKRSIRFEEMAPLFSIKNVEFYSLQKDDKQHKGFTKIIDLMDDVKDFTDTAAIIENLDLVISVDTAIAHLAAAMEKPTWMLSRKGGCWRWGLEGESTFWYPSMRIFRQEKINCWKPTIEKVTKELRKIHEL
jgi:tetratricopeptide (TPR) repeat protein